MNAGGNRVRIPAHRFAFEITHGTIPPGLQACHTCDVRRCVRPDHIFLGTPKDNMQDAVTKDRTSHGSKRYCARLAEADIPIIRGLYASGTPINTLATQFKVSRHTITEAITGHTWHRVNTVPPQTLRPRRILRGTDQGRAKLTDAQVLEIRRLHSEGLATCRELAENLSIGTLAIQRIVSRRSWKHI